MEQLLEPMLQWIQLNPHWAGLLVLLISALESLLVVGLFVPGSVIMFAVGAMVASGQMALWPTLGWAVTGAVLGDGTSYLIGRHYHQRLRVIWPFRNHPQMMAQGVDFFHRHGGKSILLARFVGPVRPLVPAVAGMLDMPPKRFFLVNILSALAWAPAYMAPGVLFGASLGLAAEVAGRLALLIGLLVTLLWFSWWLVRRIARTLQPHMASAQRRIIDWSRRHPALYPLAGALLDPEHPEARGMTILTVILVAASWVFLATLQQLTPDTLLGNLDLFVFHELQALRTPLADQWMLRVSHAGNAVVLYSFTGLICAWLLWQRYWRVVVHWLTAVAAVAILTQALKHYTMVSRPLADLNPLIGYAFPSGHASLSLAVFGFLAVAVARELPSSWRWTPYSIALFPVVAIGFSRLYLGAHWVSDILGGWSLSLVWITLLGIAYRGHPAPAIPLSRFVPVILVAVGLWLFMSALQPSLREPGYFAPEERWQTLSPTDWLENGWQALPVYRSDMRGLHRHPMNVQWAGTLQALEQHLASRGWREPTGLNPSSFMAMFASDPAVDTLPVLPQIHNGSVQALVRVKVMPDRGRLLAIRLWPTRFRLEPSQQRVWTGNASFLHRRSQTGLFSLLGTESDFDSPLRLFEQDVQPFIRAIHRATPLVQAPLQWQGRVLLIADLS